MALSLSFTDAPADRRPQFAQRALRLVTLVASLWLVTGTTLLGWPVAVITPFVHRLHLLALGCLLVAGGLYSVLLPLHLLLRGEERSSGFPA